MEIQFIPISELSFDSKNARKHDKKSIEAIKGSLRRFGQTKPIVINKEKMVLAGNGTLKAANELGWNEIAVVYTELSKNEQRAYALADNHLSDLSQFDGEVLRETLNGLLNVGFDVEDIGFDIDDVDFSD